MTDNALLAPLMGHIIEEEVELTLEQLSAACDVQTEWVIALVEEGLLEPSGDAPTTWLFGGTSLHRTRTALRLHQDLGVNLPGAALAVQLLDELNQLRARLRVMEAARRG